MNAPLLITLLGLGIGVLYGLFGVGSAFATPALSTLGVPGLAAVVAPLPGLLPGAAASAWSFSRNEAVDWTVARRTVLGALPAAIVGAVLSHHVDSRYLLLASGVLLVGIGYRILRPVRPSAAATERADRRRASATFVVTAAVGVGLFAGLLANGGGFLLVPMFLLVLGLDLRKATGTSLVVVVALTAPVVVTQALLGGIDWPVALAFGAGLVPGAALGGRLAQHLPVDKLRAGFGLLLAFFGLWYVTRQLGVL